MIGRRRTFWIDPLDASIHPRRARGRLGSQRRSTPQIRTHREKEGGGRTCADTHAHTLTHSHTHKHTHSHTHTHIHIHTPSLAHSLSPLHVDALAACRTLTHGLTGTLTGRGETRRERRPCQLAVYSLEGVTKGAHPAHELGVDAASRWSGCVPSKHICPTRCGSGPPMSSRPPPPPPVYPREPPPPPSVQPPSPSAASTPPTMTALQTAAVPVQPPGPGPGQGLVPGPPPIRAPAHHHRYHDHHHHHHHHHHNQPRRASRPPPLPHLGPLAVAPLGPAPPPYHSSTVHAQPGHERWYSVPQTRLGYGQLYTPPRSDPSYSPQYVHPLHPQAEVAARPLLPPLEQRARRGEGR